MWKQKLCIATNEQFGEAEERQIELIRAAGFDGFFCMYADGKDLGSVRRIADSCGAYFQSVHAPFVSMRKLWYPDDGTPAAVDELLHCIRDTANVGVSTVVMHAFIGFDDHMPTQQGLDNVNLLVDEAKRCNVRLAFENTEGEEYLAAIMQAFGDRTYVGFCWDSGHEMCYNHSRDMLALYGDRLFCTHLNDNLGISDFDGNITWLDDLHLLPYDGIADWHTLAERLVGTGYSGELTFELNTRSKPDRHDNDKYAGLPLADYLAEAYARACRFATEVRKASRM